MEIIGLIAEYNPLHNGHLYHINKIKEKYPNSLLVLVLNGYFLQRGEVSIISKYDKTLLALEYGVDIVISLPTLYGVQSADTFADTSIKLLNYFNAIDNVDAFLKTGETATENVVDDGGATFCIYCIYAPYG